MSTVAEIFVEVAAPPVVPHPFGLFSVVPPTDPADRWQIGMRWRSLACTTPDLLADDLCITGVDPGPKDNHDCSTDDFEAKPFTVVYARTVSGVPYEVGESEATQVVQNAEEYAVEQHVWSLMSAAAAPAAGSDLPDILALVENELAQDYHGTGIIHMSRGNAVKLASHLTRVGSQLQTAVGTPVVAGGGYGVTGPATQIFGTGAMVIHRGSLDTYRGATLSVNDFQVLAERVYAVGWDCTTVGASVTG